MKIPQGRSLDQLIGEQLVKWNSAKTKQKKDAVKPDPCITISREPGSGGSEIARELAKRLGMDLIGAQIIQQVAERADISEKVIASLDEKEVRLRDIWLGSLFSSRHLWPDEYLHHLTKVIGTIGKQGNTIIVGRGSQFILPPQETFRLRLIAPLEFRIHNVMKDSNSDFEKAERYIYKTESERDAFHRRHFHIDWTNPMFYDLIVNTGNIGIEGAVETTKTAFGEWKKRQGHV